MPYISLYVLYEASILPCLNFKCMFYVLYTPYIFYAASLLDLLPPSCPLWCGVCRLVLALLILTLFCPLLLLFCLPLWTLRWLRCLPPLPPTLPKFLRLGSMLGVTTSARFSQPRMTPLLGYLISSTPFGDGGSCLDPTSSPMPSLLTRQRMGLFPGWSLLPHFTLT